MAESITIKALQDASLDAKSLEEVVNGNELKQVTTRKGETYPSVKKAIKTMFENGALPATVFKTKALMIASSLPNGSYAVVTDDGDVNNGFYTKTSGAWVFSEFNVLKRVQDHVKHLDAKVMLDDSAPLDMFTDKYDNVFAYFDSEANLQMAGDVYKNGMLIAGGDQVTAAQVAHQSILLQQPKIKNKVDIATKAEDGLIRRMPFAIKTPTGLVYFYHKQIAGFSGDGTGSELWKAIVSIDENLNVTVVSRELFLAPDEPRGIVKHPTFGRTSDNRILLVFEKRLETTDPYTRYQCYSSDEGLTFTTPTLVSPAGFDPAGQTSSALGTTGTIVTVKNGRLVIPMYTVGGTCFVIYSDDDGVNWVFSDWVRRPHLEDWVEPSITLDANENILMDMRPLRGQYVRGRAISYNNGETWEYLGASTLISTTNQGVIFRDKSIGAMIQTHNANNVSAGYSLRTHFTLTISYDNMQTYPYSYMPYGKDWYGGYSQLIKWSEGIYILVMEYADEYIGLNQNENAGLIILSLSEVLSNVSYN